MSLLEIMRALLLRSACTQCCCLGATFGELPNATHTPSSANMLQRWYVAWWKTNSRFVAVDWILAVVAFIHATPPTSRTGQTVSVMNQPPIPSPLSAVFSAAWFPRFPPPAASNLSTGQVSGLMGPLLRSLET
ncbi:hypothetical protein JOM56_009743 [Amanita muscaria]